MSISAQALPVDALLQRHREQGAYTDCYTTQVSRVVTLADFVVAFYTTPLFRVERLLLRVVLGRGSTDREALDIATGARESFAAWSVESRGDEELLLADFSGRTRSWFKVAPLANESTQLHFGSAVVATRRDAARGAMSMPGGRFLLSFHRIYSRLLLAAAARRLRRTQPGGHAI